MERSCWEKSPCIRVWEHKGIRNGTLCGPRKAHPRSKAAYLLPPVNKKCVEILGDDIKKWRADLCTSGALTITSIRPVHFLRDAAIRKIQSQVRNVSDEEHLRSILQSAKYEFPACILSDHVSSLCQCIQLSLSDSYHLQKVPRHQQRAFPDGPTIPDAEQIQPPTALPFMRTIASIDAQIIRSSQLEIQQKTEEAEQQRQLRIVKKISLQQSQIRSHKLEQRQEQEHRKEAQTRAHEAEKRKAARKERQSREGALRDVTNQQTRTSGRVRKLSVRLRD